MTLGRRSVVVALGALLHATTAAALDPQKAITQYWRETWSVKDGLPGPSIMNITQTEDGYVWLATQAGLVRFDGVRFKLYEGPAFEGLAHRLIWSLAPGRERTLWLGVHSTGVFRHQAGVVSPFPIEPNDVWADPSTALGHVIVHEARDGRLWVSADNWGLLRVKGRAADFHAPVQRIEVLLEEPDGTLWAGTWGEGVVRVRHGEVTRFNREDGLASPYVRTMCRGRDGTMWFGGRDGLTALRDGRFRVYGTGNGLSDDDVRALLEDRDGNLWIGTGQGGLNRLRDGVFSARRRTQELSSDQIFALHEDDEGGLWIGTRGHVDRLRDTHVTMFTSLEGLPVETVVQAQPARGGGLWISTYGGGLVHRGTDGRFRTYGRESGLPNLHVGALHESRDGSLWMGVGSNQLCRLRGGRIQVLETGGKYVKAIGEDDRGLILGLSRAGIHRLEGTRVVPYRTESGEEIRMRYVNRIHHGRDGTLWLAGTDGLMAVRGGKLEVFGEPEGMPKGEVYSLHEDAEGTLWAGTLTGLVRVKGGRVARYPGQEGVDATWIFTVLEDEAGYLWLNSSRGIVRVARKELDDVAEGRAARVDARILGSQDGVALVEIRLPTIPRGGATPDGRFWFSTPGGLAMVDPRRWATDGKVPPVFIDRIVMDGREVPARDHVTVPAGTEKVEVHYTALSFTVPERVRFRYRLEGFDRDWVDAGGARVAHFTKLPPGAFRFQVKAANRDGVWNDAGASVRFSQEPRLHQTIWFQLGAAGLFGLAVFAAHRFRVRLLTADIEHRIEVERALREAQERLQESLAEKEVLVREIHHRVKNNFQITISLLNLQSASMKDSPAQRILRDSQDRVRSMALVHERLYDFGGRSGRIDGKEYLSSLVESLFTSYGVPLGRVIPSVTVDGIDLRLEAAVPCGLIVNELVSNALKHAFPGGRAGRVAVSLARNEAGFVLRVSDDGVGLPADVNFRRTDTLGLQLVDTLVAQLDGTMARLPGAGTAFEVRFAEPQYKERLGTEGR